MEDWENSATIAANETISAPKKKYSFKVIFSLLGVFVLSAGVSLAVMASQQSTEQRSRAYYGGGDSYDGGYDRDGDSRYGGGSSYDGGYDRDGGGSYGGGDSYGGSDAYRYPTTAPKISTTKPSPTIAWTSIFNIFPTKIVSPTPVKIPTPTKISMPQITAMPQATEVPAPTPTDLPGFESTPEPTEIPEPTPTPDPSDTVLALTLGLHGIGTAGERVNAASIGNEKPMRTERIVSIDVYNLFNQLVTNHRQTIIYDDASGKFEGAINLGPLDTGAYTFRIKTDQYLSSRMSRVYINEGEINQLPTMLLRGGDVNGDDKLSILDYNMLMGCYSDLLPAIDCNGNNESGSDLNDDGQVNQIDYNFFLRELSFK